MRSATRVSESVAGRTLAGRRQDILCLASQVRSREFRREALLVNPRMSLPSLAVNRPVLANLMMILIVIGGLLSYRNMGQEIFPQISTEMVTVSTFMQGASPKEIEQLLTIPLEEEISKIDQIDNITSTSAENFSTIVIQFDVGIDNIFEKVTEIQNQIEKVERFPEEAEAPEVREQKTTFETITMAVVGRASEKEVREFVIDFEIALKGIAGVAEVDVSGLREREIWVEADPYRLQSYGLSLQQVAESLGRRNLNLPGGLIRFDRGELSVRTEAEFRDLDEILGTILRQDDSGGFVYLRDVATVRDTFAERMTLARLDGDPSINININKDTTSSAIEIVADVKEAISVFEGRLPAGAEIRVVNDSSVDISNRLRALFQNFSVGLLLVALSFTLAIGWRAALIISAGIPVAFLGAFIFLNAYGFTMNQLVITAMIIVLGLIVDDAIVVCENIYRHMEAGMPLRRAAIFGAEQIMGPIVATVLTTVAAFLPLLMMTGTTGKFMRTIPIVVCLALLASLFETFFILPAHAYEWTGTFGRRAQPRPKGWIVALTSLYARLIEKALRRRYWVVLSLVLVAAAAAALATRMDFILYGGSDLRSFSVAMEGRTSASFGETDRILTEIEAAMMKLKERTPAIESVRTRGGSLRRGYTSVNGTHVGEVSVDLLDLASRERSGHDVLAEARKKLGDVAGARVLGFEANLEVPGVGRAVNVRAKGPGFETLVVIAEEVKSYLRTLEGVVDIADDFPPGKDEVRPVLDLQEVAAVGLDVRQIAAEIRGGFEGIEATRIYDGDEEVEVMVKYHQSSRRSIANLAEMKFASPTGMIPFSNLGTVARRPGYNNRIAHHDSQRVINITASVREGVVTAPTQ